jgi:cobalamin biosynthesis Mg chelatase CobN
MPKKLVSALLVFAVALVTVPTQRVFAQESAANSTIESNSSTQPATSSSDLRTSMAAEIAKVKAGPLTKADIKRIEKEQQGQHYVNSAKPSFTRRQKIFLALWIVVMTGVVWGLIKHACKDPNPCPEPDPTDYNSY